jgi:hypothetical protein
MRPLAADAAASRRLLLLPILGLQFCSPAILLGHMICLQFRSNSNILKLVGNRKIPKQTILWFSVPLRLTLSPMPLLIVCSMGWFLLGNPIFGTTPRNPPVPARARPFPVLASPTHPFQTSIQKLNSFCKFYVLSDCLVLRSMYFLSPLYIKDITPKSKNGTEALFLSAATLVAADYGFTCPPTFMSVCL